MKEEQTVHRSVTQLWPAFLRGTTSQWKCTLRWCAGGGNRQHGRHTHSRQLWPNARFLMSVAEDWFRCSVTACHLLVTLWLLDRELAWNKIAMTSSPVATCSTFTAGFPQQYFPLSRFLSLFISIPVGREINRHTHYVPSPVGLPVGYQWNTAGKFSCRSLQYYATESVDSIFIYFLFTSQSN